MTMWHVPYGGTAPIRVEVAKLSKASCLLEDGTRVPHNRVYRTWTAAHDVLLLWAEENLLAARAHLQRMVNAKESILALTEPEET